MVVLSYVVNKALAPMDCVPGIVSFDLDSLISIGDSDQELDA